MLPPGRGNERITGRTELRLIVGDGARATYQSAAAASAGSETTSQHIAPQQQQSSQSYSSSSSSSQRQNLSDNEPVARSQFDSLSVCTRRDLQYCNDDDDRSERTFTRQTAARIRGHCPGRSHSQPLPSQHTRELGPVPTTCSLMTANTAAVRSVECRTVCTSDKKNIQPPREYMDNSIRPRPVQPQPTVWGTVRHQLDSPPVSQGVRSVCTQFIDRATLPIHSHGAADTQPTHPARKPVAAMQAGDASPGSEDTPMPIRRPTGVQMDFRQRQTIPVSAQQVSYGDQSLPTRLSRTAGANAELLMGQADKMPSADMASRDTVQTFAVRLGISVAAYYATQHAVR